MNAVLKLLDIIQIPESITGWLAFQLCIAPLIFTLLFLQDTQRDDDCATEQTHVRGSQVH